MEFARYIRSLLNLQDKYYLIMHVGGLTNLHMDLGFMEIKEKGNGKKM